MLARKGGSQRVTFLLTWIREIDGLTLVIALAANIIRILVTAILHKTAGSELADLVFHDLAGWLMMPLALGMLWLELLVLSWVLRPGPTEEEVVQEMGFSEWGGPAVKPAAKPAPKAAIKPAAAPAAPESTKEVETAVTVSTSGDQS